MCYTSLFLGGFSIHHHFLRALEFHDELNCFLLYCMFIPGGKATLSETTPLNATRIWWLCWATVSWSFGAYEIARRWGLLVGPPVGGQDFFWVQKLEAPFFFNRLVKDALTPFFASRGFYIIIQKGTTIFFFKWWLTSRDLSLKTTCGKNAHTHTQTHKIRNKSIKQKARFD